MLLLQDVPPTEPTDKTESAEVEISNAAENEKLEKVQDVDGDQKESNYNRTNTDETVEKKEDSCEVQMSKLETSMSRQPLNSSFFIQ